MDYYKKYIEQLNRYAGGLGIVVCKDWGASVAPLQACLDDLQGLSDAYLDEADEEHKRAKLERRAAVGDYLTKLDVVADKDEIVRGMMAQLGEVATGARELVKSGEWTKEQYMKWYQQYNNCITLWEQKANEIAVELDITGTPEKEKADMAHDINVTQLFVTIEDYREFFSGENLLCAQWARRAFIFIESGRLYLDMKNDIKTLYDGIKKKYPQIASLKTFQNTLKTLRNKAL